MKTERTLMTKKKIKEIYVAAQTLVVDATERLWGSKLQMHVCLGGVANPNNL